MSAARDTILARVRTALAGATKVEPLPDVLPSRFFDPASLVESFVRGATDAGAQVTLVADFAAVADQVRRIAAVVGLQSVVVSPDAAAAPWQIGPAALPGVVLTVTERATPDRGDRVFGADAGVTAAAYGVADTGTLVLCASAGQHRLDSLAPPAHIALVRARDLVPDLGALFAALARDERFAAHSAVTFVRGPSRTADVELTLSIGVHGPRSLHIVVSGDGSSRWHEGHEEHEAKKPTKSS